MGGEPTLHLLNVLRHDLAMTTITIHSFDDDTTPHAISLVSVLGLTLD